MVSTQQSLNKQTAEAAVELPGAAVASQFEILDVDVIDPSDYNFRKNFDEEPLQELADSIAVKGVIEPIIVRPKPSTLAKNKREQGVVEALGLDPRRRYEIVAGERRWRASKLAGVKTIPAIIREYSDLTALEIQIIENEQRKDLTPLERAAGYEAMVERMQYSVESIAAKVGKSTSYVRGYLKLNLLPPLARESLMKGIEGGGISRSVAELIARIPDEKNREKAAKQIVNYGTEPMNFRTAKEYIERTFMCELKGAPFSLDDAALVPAAGSCEACPMRSGNTPEQYAGKRTDMCLQPGCFQKKVEAHHTRALEEFRANGHTILPASEAKAMFPHGDSYISGNTKYVLLNAACYEDARTRTYAKILGKDYKAIIAQTPRGTVVQLGLKTDVRKALDEGKPKGAAGTKGTRAGAPLHDRRDPERELMDAAVYESAVQLARKVEAGDGSVPADLLRAIIKNELDIGVVDELEKVVEWRGIACEKGKEEEAIEKLLPTMGYKQLLGLYVELRFLAPYYAGRLDEEQKVLLKIYGVDFEKMKASLKKKREEWQKKLKSATTADVMKVEVAQARLKPGGDIEVANSNAQIAANKPVKTFGYEGETFTNTGGVTGEYLNAVRVVARADYKGKVFKYGEKRGGGAGFYEGILVQWRGEECVLTGPTLKCVPAILKQAAGKGKR
jgi:ParB/RepB/Spo0J family partition protein